jgi:hypothetical protein
MMRCGGNSRSHITDVAVFDAADQTTGWSPWTLGQMRRRILHRATVLPTGDVLVTGGVKDISDEVGQRIPQLWNEALGWGDSTLLAPEPALRGYHGTALLLPDGRVLTTGGSSAGQDPYRACVFEPPYLFDAAGGYVRQSVLVGVPPAASHGQELAVTLAEPGDAPAITAAVLVRPSAVTHDPNFTQHRVPLAFTREGDVLHLALPTSPNVAPPGDYLLFVLRDSAGVQVPSIASWIRLTLADVLAAGGGPGGRPALRTWPNPASGELQIAFTMPRPGRVRLAVYDAAGRTVRALVHADLDAGAHSARWDGRDGSGRAAAPGRYYVRLVSEGGSRSRPFTLRR